MHDAATNDLRARGVRALVTAFAAAALAWWCGPALSAACAGAPAECVVEAPGPDDRNPVARSNEVWLRKVVADGRTLRLDELRREGAWEQIGGWPSPVLVHRNDPDPARVAFRARTAAVEFVQSEWCGIARLRRDGDATDVDGYGPPETTVWVDLSAPPRAAWLLAAPWLAFALAWAIVRPWRDARRAACFVGVALCAAHLVAAVVLPVDTTDDSGEYLRCLARNLTAGEPAYFPPGYGLFLAACDAVPGATVGGAATFCQHLLAAAALWTLRPLVAAALGELGALLWLALATWLAPALLAPRLVMSETLAFALMAFAVAAAHAGAATWRPSRFVLAGAALGAAVVTRVVPLAGVAPAIALLAVGLPWRRGLAAAGVTLAAAVAVVAVPVSWFAAHGHGVALSSAVGRHLYNRVVHEQKVIAPSGPATDRVRAALPGVDVTTLPHWDLYAALAATDARTDAEDLVAAMGVEALRAHFAAYLAFTVPHTWRNLTADASGYLAQGAGTQRPAPDYEAPAPLGTTGAAMAHAQQLARATAATWPWLCWASLIGVLVAVRARAPRAVLALAAVPYGYLFATSLVEYHLPRYQFAVAPFVLAVALAPLCLMGRRGAAPRFTG